MTNEAAERLRQSLHRAPGGLKLLDAALATERQRTVERIIGRIKKANLHTHGSTFGSVEAEECPGCWANATLDSIASDENGGTP